MTEVLREDIQTIDGRMFTDAMGYHGNVWVRKQYFPKAGVSNMGHAHDHDHVSLLSNGSLIVKVEGKEPVRYIAPAFIYIEAHKHHELIAQEDNTVAWCVFAIYEDGVRPDKNTPYKEVGKN